MMIQLYNEYDEPVITARVIKTTVNYQVGQIYVTNDYIVDVPSLGQTTIHTGGYIRTTDKRNTRREMTEVVVRNTHWATLDHLRALTYELNRMGIHSERVFLSLDLPEIEEKGIFVGKDSDTAYNEED